MLELMLIVVLMISGAALGGFTAGEFVDPELALLSAIVGGIVGIAFAYLFLANLKLANLRKKAMEERPLPTEQTAIGTQIPFQARMANYLGIAESETLKTDSYKSTMPFWSIVDVYWRRTVRTAHEIRAILLRMRERFRNTK